MEVGDKVRYVGSKGTLPTNKFYEVLELQLWRDAVKINVGGYYHNELFDISVLEVVPKFTRQQGKFDHVKILKTGKMYKIIDKHTNYITIKGLTRSKILAKIDEGIKKKFIFVTERKYLEQN